MGCEHKYYVINLSCDIRPDVLSNYPCGYRERITGVNRTDCFSKARKSGWSVNFRRGQNRATCPSCNARAKEAAAQ